MAYEYNQKNYTIINAVHNKKDVFGALRYSQGLQHGLAGLCGSSDYHLSNYGNSSTLQVQIRAMSTAASRSASQMSDTAKNPFDALLDAFREIVREEISALKTEINGQDRLLDAEEAAQLLAVSQDWLYRNAKRLPFARKLAPKMLRFSYQGMLKYIAARKPN